jgi:hypothetical protein
MIDAVEVLQKIYAHVRGDIDLPSFREWMVGAQLELEHHKDSHAHDLVWQLEIFYAEYSDGLADEVLWRKSLVYLADQERPGTESSVVAYFDIAPSQRILSFGTSSPSGNSLPQMEPELLQAH